MGFHWSHVRNILITGKNLRTRIAIPLYDIDGELKSVRRIGNELIIDYAKKSQKLNPPGLDTPASKKDAAKTRDASSLRQADRIPSGEEWLKSTDRHD